MQNLKTSKQEKLEEIISTYDLKNGLAREIRNKRISEPKPNLSAPNIYIKHPKNYYPTIKEILAIKIAVQEYITAQKQQYQRQKSDSWRYEGLRQAMNIRQAWQQRAGATAGSPVTRKEYPLLRLHYH